MGRGFEDLYFRAGLPGDGLGLVWDQKRRIHMQRAAESGHYRHSYAYSSLFKIR